MRRIYLVGIALALAAPPPARLAAQVPNPGNGKLIPSAHASDTAKAKVAAAMAHRATHVRGEAVGPDNQPVTPATPATRAVRAQPGAGEGGRAIPATPAVPATPASPALAHRPPQAGTGHGRKP